MLRPARCLRHRRVVTGNVRVKVVFDDRRAMTVNVPESLWISERDVAGCQSHNGSVLLVPSVNCSEPLACERDGDDVPGCESRKQRSWILAKAVSVDKIFVYGVE